MAAGTNYNHKPTLHAGNLMKNIMAKVGGGGGGSTTFARGGCRADKIDEAFAEFRRYIEEYSGK